MNDERQLIAMDYEEGMKAAAHRVILDVGNLLRQYSNEMMIIGGWVPLLQFPDKEHIGSTDVDVLFNNLEMTDPGYLSVKRILLQNGYTPHEKNFFTFQKVIEIDGVPYTVDLDLLSGMGDSVAGRSTRFHGLKALALRGGELAFQVPAQTVTVEGKRPDGALDSTCIRVVAMMPFLVLKADALGRGKPKDSYDIIHCLKCADFDELIADFRNLKDVEVVAAALEQLEKKFASVEHAGPIDYADFLAINEPEERAMICQDAFQWVNALLVAVNRP